jgi:PQQ-like domain
VSTVLIDLGENWTPVERPPGRPGRPRPRPALAVLVAIVALLLLGGAAAPRPPFLLLATIPVTPGAGTEIGDGAVFVGPTTGLRTVTRYPLSDGPAWTVAVDNLPESLIYLPAAGVLVVLSYNDTNETRFTVLDAGTGARLWAGTASLLSDPRFGRYVMRLSGTPSGGAELHSTDLRTGRDRWSRPVPAGVQLMSTRPSMNPGGRPVDDPAAVPDVLVAAPDGTVTLLAATTGQALATAQVGDLTQPGADFNPDRLGVLDVVGDQLVVVRPESVDRVSLAAYGLPGLTRRWTRDDRQGGFPLDCGPVVCLVLPDGLAGIDRNTGATRWQTPDWRSAGYLAGTRMIGYRENSPSASALLDTDTGRVVLDFAGWTMVGGSDLLLTAPVAGDYRSAWFARLDWRRATIQPLGRLDGIGTAGCQAWDDLLLCRTLDAKLKVWRYRT